jgi:hypothetical protein
MAAANSSSTRAQRRALSSVLAYVLDQEARRRM